MNKLQLREETTERYINIAEFQVTDLEDIAARLYEVAQKCHRRFKALFASNEITTHELYCGLFVGGRRETALVWLKVSDMKQFHDLRVSIALNIYRAE